MYYYMEKAILNSLKKDDIIPILDKHYEQLGRPIANRPDYKKYSLAQLKKCLIMFGIVLTRVKD